MYIHVHVHVLCIHTKVYYTTVQVYIIYVLCVQCTVHTLWTHSIESSLTLWICTCTMYIHVQCMYRQCTYSACIDNVHVYIHVYMYICSTCTRRTMLAVCT